MPHDRRAPAASPSLSEAAAAAGAADSHSRSEAPACSHAHGHAHGHAHAHGHGQAPAASRPASGPLGHGDHGRHGHHGHSHLPDPSAGERPLWIAFGLTFCVFLAELAGGLLTGSLALLSDAAHMLTDVAALAIAIGATRLSRRPPDPRRTFGYARFEIVAAAVNASLLFLAAGYILFEAVRRVFAPEEVQSIGMLVVAGIGLAANLISMRALAAGKDGNLNMRGAYLEVWSDMLGSVGVIVGAIAIRLTGWAWIDSLVAVAIGLWVLPRAKGLLRESLNILLEGVPDGIEATRVREAIATVPGVRGLHDLHLWAIASGKPSLTVHVLVDPAADAEFGVLPAIRERLADMGIHHVTIQAETRPCEHGILCADGTGADHFDPKNH